MLSRLICNIWGCRCFELVRQTSSGGERRRIYRCGRCHRITTVTDMEVGDE